MLSEGVVPIVTINNSMYGLTKQYFRRGGSGFTSAVVTGERRVGKTMYCLQTVYQICRYKGMSEEEAWKTALDSIIFTMKDFVKILKTHNYKNRRDFIIWDDAGVNASGLLYRYNMDNAAILKALMDTVGTRVRLLMLTTPDFEGLMKFLRRYQDYLVFIEPYYLTYGVYGRLATVVKPYRRKNLARGWAKAWRDEYKVTIDDEVYSKYQKIRDNYADIIIKELEKYGKDGEAAIRGTFGEERTVVRQTELLSDLVSVDTEGEFSSD
jgi:hypothetical protein